MAVPKLRLVFIATSLLGYVAMAEEVWTPICYYAFNMGSEKTAITPCGPDSLAIGVNPRVIAVMRHFGIAKEEVSFRSCPRGDFYAMADSKSNSHFLIHYPSNAPPNYLAPIAHELAHVFQMKSVAGFRQLDPQTDSRRIELGADFLAGLAFHAVLRDLQMGDFETNIKLVGSYVPSNRDHGCPEHRTQAFRLGAINADPYNGLTDIQAVDYFYGNHYANLSC